MSYELSQGTIIAPLPLTERGLGIHLGGTLKIKPRLLYSSQNLIIQREINDFNKCSIFSEHPVKVNVAKYSPSGEWICSGDDSGKTLVWTHQSSVIKNTIEVGRKVTDIAWDSEGQRIFAVGNGKDDKAKVFPWNSNNKLGDISGASKGYLSCDFKPSRPYRLISSSEDFGVYYYKGPPFIFESYDKTHKNFVNCVRFSSDGNHYLSVGSDKLIILFDGKTGAKMKEIKDETNGHKGSIYEVSWSPDNTKFITSSADKTCKIWSINLGKVLTTFNFGDAIADMQVSCLWLDNSNIFSISLSGKINVLKYDNEQKDDEKSDAVESKPFKVISGHRKPIQDQQLDRKNGLLYTCDTDSRILKTDLKNNNTIYDFIGDPHNATLIKHIRLSFDKNYLYSIGVDDRVIKHSLLNNNLVLNNNGADLNGSGRGIGTFNSHDKYIIVGTHKNKLLVINSENINELKIVNTIDINYAPCYLTISYNDAHLAVGGEDNKIHIYDLSNGINNIKEIFVINNNNFIRDNITCLSYSYDNKFLASCDRNRHIWVWSVNDINNNNNNIEPLNKLTSYQFHNAAPCYIEWSLDSKMLVSGGHDNNIYLWYNAFDGSNNNVHFDNAFHGSIKTISFYDDRTLIGSSSDATIRFFNINKK